MIEGTEPFARDLRRLEPARHGINRDSLMFQAGQRSVQRRLRTWQSLAGLMVFLAVSLAWLNRNPLPPAEPMMASLPAAPPAHTASAMESAQRSPAGLFAEKTQRSVPEYLALRKRVMLEGMDALPSPVGALPSLEPIPSIADGFRIHRVTLASEPFRFFRSFTKGNPS